MSKEVLPNDTILPSDTSTNKTKVVIKSPASLDNSALKALSVYCDNSSSDEERDERDNVEAKTVDYPNFVIPIDGELCDVFNSTIAPTKPPEPTKPSEKTNYEVSLSSSSSSSSDEDSISSEESELSAVSDVSVESVQKKKEEYVCNKTKGELTLDDLPPIQDLCISVPEDQCVIIGHITSIVDKLVVVQALPDLPPIDLDTVLFLEPNKPLGVVFDVIGPVKEPLYCVRFNSGEQIKEKEISVGEKVYYVPTSNHTKYVFVAHLMRVKGCDASWEDNNEPPPECLDYSDDEQERKALKTLKLERSKLKKEVDDDVKKRISSSIGNNNTQHMKANERRGRPFKKNQGRRNNSDSLMRLPVFDPPSSSFECRSSSQNQMNFTSPHPQFPNVVSTQFPGQVLGSPVNRPPFPIDISKPPPLPVSPNISLPLNVVPNMSMPPPVIHNSNIPLVPLNVLPPNMGIPPPGPSFPNMFSTPPSTAPGGTLSFNCNTPPPFSMRHFQNNNGNAGGYPSSSVSVTLPPQPTFGFNNNLQTPPFPPPNQGVEPNTSNFNQWRGRLP